jgi:hypothetical protein
MAKSSKLKSLAAELRLLDRALRKHDPETFRELGKAASASNLAKLSKRVLAGRKVPAQLVTWFSWHDGQKGTTRMPAR